MPQAIEPSNYHRNFPTTGLNNLYFDLETGGVENITLTWPTISKGGITATMTPTPSEPNNIRVTLTGPEVPSSQWSSASPSRVATPTLPQTFEIVGYDSSHRKVLSYGFVLEHWFVHRGDKMDSAANHSSWCSNLGGGYHLPQVKDLTNAKCGKDVTFPCGGGIDGAIPASNYNLYQRNIGAGLFTEWGNMPNYPDSGFANNYYWTSDNNGTDQFAVYSGGGSVYIRPASGGNYGVCIYP